MPAARNWYADTTLSWGARGLLWDFLRRGPGRGETLDEVADRARTERPSHADPPDLIAAWLAELTKAGALTLHAGRYMVPADRELDVLAAKLAGVHLSGCRPPLPREEAARHQTLIRELIAGHRDPADVETALHRWRSRRAAGERVSRSLILMILEDAELEWRQAATEAGTLCAVTCRDCGGCHEEGTPCPPGPRW